MALGHDNYRRRSVESPTPMRGALQNVPCSTPSRNVWGRGIKSRVRPSDGARAVRRSQRVKTISHGIAQASLSYEVLRAWDVPITWVQELFHFAEYLLPLLIG